MAIFQFATLVITRGKLMFQSWNQLSSGERSAGAPEDGAAIDARRWFWDVEGPCLGNT